MDKKEKGQQSLLDFKNQLLVQILSMQVSFIILSKVLRNIFSSLKKY